MLLFACSDAPDPAPDSELDRNSDALHGNGHGGGGGSCSPRDTADTTCDRVDDDCDGRKDEDCEFGPSDCPRNYRVITGTFHADTLTGTSGRDCILGYGGNDTIEGLGQDDFLVGGPGNDAIEGGPGDDEIFGNDGADSLSGGLGRDVIEGGEGNDDIEAGAGNDDVSGGRCHDFIKGGLGSDDLDGNSGSDRIVSLSIFNSVDGGNGIDACAGSSCEVALSVATCTSDAQCTGGKRCTANTGICVSPAVVPFTDTTCDGIDDDCDGLKDEEFGGGTTTCGVGACRRTGGAQCVNGEVVGTMCTPGTPAANDATCNGTDDDCDGRTDENFVGGPITCGVGACERTGSVQCVNGQTQNSCVPGTAAPNDATCDSVDDDCNGQKDEDFVGGAITCGFGACERSGTIACVAGNVQNSCTPGTPAPNDATCDGIDDDCDQQTDESYMPMPIGCGIGVCARTGVTSCSGGMVQNSCVPGMPAANDATCNGLDEDCSGIADEDYAPHVTTCGMGSCSATGISSCVAGMEQNNCTPGSGGGTDATCDGVDDDCSGQIDEDYVPHGTMCGVGECASTGVTSCVGGEEEDSCTPDAPAPSDATCNNSDEDCDADFDEDYAAVATECGVGACFSTGTTSCVGGEIADNCAPGEPAANDATCNGIDEDCSGAEDEDFAQTPTDCGIGACASTGVTVCVDGEVDDTCLEGTPAPSDATCNGVDDDCNGQNDEDFAPSCSGTDRNICNNGQSQVQHCDDGNVCTGVETCTPAACVAGEPIEFDDGDPCTADACDPLNGTVTNTPVPEGTSCSNGEVCDGEELCLLSGGGCTTMPANAVSWWRAENTPNDSVGTNHGVLANGATYAPGHVGGGQAFSFDGINKGVDLTSVAAGVNLTNVATLEAWIRFTGTDTCRTVFSLAQDPTHNLLFQVGNGCTGAFGNELITYNYINGSGVDSSVAYATNARSELIDGNWHHVAVTLNGSATAIYLDGVSKPASIGSGSAHGRWGNFASPVNAAIGGRNQPPNFSATFNGQIDEVTLYNRALTAGEIATIFFAGANGKCSSTPVLTCVAAEDEPVGTPCGIDGECDGAGMCVP